MITDYSNLSKIDIIDFDIYKYQFRQKIQQIFNTNEIEKLHHGYENYFLERNKDQSTIFHKKFYDSYESYEFKNLYTEFVKDFCTNLFGEGLIYQAKPTFRIHMPDNVGVGEFHKDSDYNHPIEEFNILLPFTDAIDTQTIWVETDAGLGDYKPINLKYGNIIVFRGGYLKHGNLVNKTENTRLSIDFRVIPKSIFVPNNFGSINTNLKFVLGEYYSECER